MHNTLYSSTETEPCHQRDCKFVYKKNPSLNYNDDFLNDDLATHLVDQHKFSNRYDFDASYYNVFILRNSSPTNLEDNEHHLMLKC